MINYIRTCLWNRPASEVTSFRGCDLFIPTDFRPILDQPALILFRNALFGDKPDYAFLLYRTHILLSLLHTSYYRRYVYDWDNRLTYDLQEPLLRRLFTTDVQSFGEQAVRVEGEPVVDEDTGVCYTSFVIRGEQSSPTVSVRDLKNINAWTINRNTVIQVPSTPIRLLLPASGDFSANIYVATQPNKNIADIALDVNHSLAKDVVKVIFANNKDEPLDRLRVAYHGESDATEQFALLCFAVARFTAVTSIAGGT